MASKATRYDRLLITSPSHPHTHHLPIEGPVTPSISRFLFRQDPESIRHTDRDGFTCLHHVARKGHSVLAKELLRYRADVKAQDQWGMTPLHRAVAKGNMADSLWSVHSWWFFWCFFVLSAKGKMKNCNIQSLKLLHIPWCICLWSRVGSSILDHIRPDVDR